MAEVVEILEGRRPVEEAPPHAVNEDEEENGEREGESEERK